MRTVGPRCGPAAAASGGERRLPPERVWRRHTLQQTTPHEALWRLRRLSRSCLTRRQSFSTIFPECVNCWSVSMAPNAHQSLQPASEHCPPLWPRGACQPRSTSAPAWRRSCLQLAVLPSGATDRRALQPHGTYHVRCYLLNCHGQHELGNVGDELLTCFVLSTSMRLTGDLPYVRCRIARRARRSATGSGPTACRSLPRLRAGPVPPLERQT